MSDSQLHALKVKYGVSLELSSCHTALMQGYVLEGHTPVDVIARLLKEKPPVVGLAVRRMPIAPPEWRTPILNRTMCSLSTGWVVRRCTPGNNLQHARVFGTGFHRPKAEVVHYHSDPENLGRINGRESLGIKSDQSMCGNVQNRGLSPCRSYRAHGGE